MRRWCATYNMPEYNISKLVHQVYEGDSNTILVYSKESLKNKDRNPKKFMSSLRAVIGLRGMRKDIDSIEQDVVVGNYAENYLLIKFKERVTITNLLSIHDKKSPLRRYKEFLLNVVHSDDIEACLYPGEVMEWLNGAPTKEPLNILKNDCDYCMTARNERPRITFGDYFDFKILQVNSVQNATNMIVEEERNDNQVPVHNGDIKLFSGRPPVAPPVKPPAPYRLKRKANLFFIQRQKDERMKYIAHLRTLNK